MRGRIRPSSGVLPERAVQRTLSEWNSLLVTALMANEQQHDQGLFSPPTPRSTNGDESSRRTTRSGRAMTSDSPRKSEGSPRPKPTPKRKAKAAKSDKHKTPRLTAPLSILTKELHHIPVKNMEEWVNRPADVRRREVEKRNGYITRPMNSFMLYRSAFADRAKSWCLQNNHQVVSSVAGESWPLEPPEIRELYDEYSKIERLNHRNAHPTYKFSPSKGTVLTARKRKNEWSDDEEPSDLDDVEWAPAGGRPRPRQVRRVDSSFGYPSNNVRAEYFDRSFGPNGNGMNRSSWEMASEGRPMPMPMPMPMSNSDQYNQYYQTAAYPPTHMSPNYADDVMLRRVDTPVSSLQFQTSPSVLGLPGGDLLQQLHSHDVTPFDEAQLDPMLLAYNGGGHSNIDPLALQQDGYQIGQQNAHEGKLDQQHLDNLLDLPHDEYHGWQSDPTMTSLEQESEFDKWMGE
ncbi:HMG box [Pyrenophora seminiperda CCB06]|uniref:HMG box n=1 Tax=Pyrenophora seminiperda CCB06 TaxID=1302712 RepID=A0A3M7M3T1_9PLEO|nr:HMG box [Pyrenophora seminiperda CCB06]